MKKPSDDDDRHHSSSDNKLEELANSFLARHPRFLLYAGISLLVLVIAAILVAKLSSNSR